MTHATISLMCRTLTLLLHVAFKYVISLKQNVIFEISTVTTVEISNNYCAEM